MSLGPLVVDAALLRALETPELRLVPGRALMARVVDREPTTGRGSLAIAGVRLAAALPAGVRGGDVLRLVVREATPERIVLSITDPTAQADPAAQLTPDGQNVDEDGGGGARDRGAAGVVSLRYQAPNLGPVDMQFALGNDALAVTVTLPAGVAAEASQASAQLTSELEQAMGRAVTVAVVARREPLDIYA